MDRRMATPHYKISQRRMQALALGWVVFLAFTSGAMLGATVAMGVMQ